MSEANALKPQYGWSVATLLPVVPAISRFFVRRRVSANVVSWLSLAAFLIGLAAYVIAPDTLVVRVLAVALFVLGTLLDVADGHVARMSNAAGPGGAYLDAGIDLVRYNLFFVALWAVALRQQIEVAGLLIYAVLLNLSFVKLFRGIGRGGDKRVANSELGRHLPAAYREFCLKYRLLFNPLNLEDQLLLYFFVVGVIFRQEVIVLWVCLAARLVEVAIIVLGKARRYVNG